jgi:hypothetical protein
MKNWIYIAVVFVLICSSALNAVAQTDSLLRYYLYGDSTNQQGNEIIYTSEGKLAIIGTSNTIAENNSDIVVLMIDTNGLLLWTKSYGSTGIEEGNAIRETKDGGFVLVGTTNSYGLGGYDMYVIKIDKDGEQLWEAFGGGAEWDFGNDIIEKHDSGFYVCGSTYSDGNGNEDAYLLELDKDGNFINEWWFGDVKNDIFHACAVSQDSHYVFVGETILAGQDSSDILFIELDDDGNLLQDTAYGGTGVDIGFDIIETKDQNGYIIVGATTSIQPLLNTPTFEGYYLRLFKDGSVKREDAYGNEPSGNMDDINYCVVELNTGDLALAGFTETFGAGQKDISIIISNGDGWWTDKSKNYGFSQLENIFGSTVDASGTYYGVGVSNSIGNGHEDIMVIRIDTFMQPPSVLTDSIATIPFSVQVSNQEILASKNIKIYPIPFKEELNIEFGEETPEKLQILDVNGKIIEEWNTLRSNQKRLQLQLPQGCYFLNMQFEKDTKTIKLVK